MDPILRNTLREALVRSLNLLESTRQAGLPVEQHLIYRRTDIGWGGAIESRPSFVSLLMRTHDTLAQINREFVRQYRAAYGDELIGVGGLTFVNVLHDDTQLMRAAIVHRWGELGPFSADARIDSAIDDIEQFAESPTFTLHYQAPLMGWHSTTDDVRLTPSIRVRRLSELEVTQTYGGELSQRAFSATRSSHIHEFVAEGSLSVPKLTLNDPRSSQDFTAECQHALEDLVLLLRTHQAGMIGYEQITYRVDGINPFGISTTSGRTYVPFGRYSVEAEDLRALQRLAARLLPSRDAALLLACRRLADAEARLRPEDQLVDAVIGMEALLLATIGERYGELVYRFSTHYAVLHAAADRKLAFKAAKDLYNLRSKIAHGSPLDAQLRVGNDLLSLTDAARNATDALRWVIMRILDVEPTGAYKQMDFWTDRAFPTR